MQVQSYLFFEGRCDEALDFYRRTLGAETLMLMRYKDAPDPAACGGASPEKVMHASFRIGETTVFASDGRCEGNPAFHGFSLSITVNADAEAERLFKALSDGGQTIMPMDKTFFASRFGMLADRFGVTWMILSQPH